MLVLSRRSHESIVIPGCDVTITILGIQGSHVRVGVTAPRSVVIHRKEVWDRLATELGLESAHEPTWHGQPARENPVIKTVLETVLETVLDPVLETVLDPVLETVLDPVPEATPELNSLAQRHPK